MARPTLPFEYVEKYFQNQGCTLLEKTFEGSKAPLRYRCKCGKVRVTCFNNFSRGYRCMLCYLKRFHASRKKRLQRLELRAKMYTVSDVARMLNVPVSDMHSAIHIKQILPGPKRKLGCLPRRYYNEQDVRQLMKLVKY